MSLESSIVKEVREHVVKVLSNQLSDDITYHSINHTLDVVSSANEIAREQGLSEEELEILTIAAWFHDIGYIKSSENHEKRGAEKAEEFLVKRNYPTINVERVEGCILATQMPQSPKNNLEKIMCDADLMHLAGDDYFKKADLLHKELEKTKVCTIPEDEWLQMSQEFLSKHSFFTDYARHNYEFAVKENLRKVRERLSRWKKSNK